MLDYDFSWEPNVFRQLTGLPHSSSPEQPHGGLLDCEWPCARIGHYAFETDAFFSDCFC